MNSFTYVRTFSNPVKTLAEANILLKLYRKRKKYTWIGFFVGQMVVCCLMAFRGYSLTFTICAINTIIWLIYFLIMYTINSELEDHAVTVMESDEFAKALLEKPPELYEFNRLMGFRRIGILK